MMNKLRLFISKSWKNDFIQGFLIIFSGSTLAQAIPLLATIYLGRVFPNEAFGLFFLYSTSVLIMSILATLKYELAIVLPKNEIESINLLALSLIISLGISIIVLLIVILFNTQLSNLLGDPRIGFWLYFLPLSLLFSGVFQATNNWFLWQRKYKNISLANVSKSTGTATAQITTGFLKLTQIGLIPGLIFGQGLASVLNITFALKQCLPKLKHLSLKKMKTLAIRHRNLPMFSTLLGLANTLSNQLPILLLTKFFGLTITSYYGMANRLIGVPLGLVSQSVGQVFFKKASALVNDKGDLKRLILKTYLNLALIGITPFLLLFFLAPLIFKYLIGENWIISGTYVRILIPWLFIGFLNIPITRIITVLKKQKSFLVYEILLLIFRFIALSFGYHFYNDPLIALYLFSGTGVIFNLALMLLLLYYSKQYKIEKY